MVETGGDSYATERQQDSGNNYVALAPGVVVAYDRNTYSNTLLQAGVEVIVNRRRARARPRRRPLHDLPADPRPGRLLM